MPFPFLDLPRELRDEIYAYVFLQSNYITISPRPRQGIGTTSRSLSPATFNKSTSISTSSSPSFTLLTVDPCPLACEHLSNYHVKDGKCMPDRHSNRRSCRTTISLSLQRVCQQIYDETKGMLWDNHVMYFPDFVLTTFNGGNNSPPTLGVVKTLKSMGQTASRLIQRITICMPIMSHSYSELKNVFSALGSRSRHGSLRKVELIWDSQKAVDLAWASLSWRNGELVAGPPTTVRAMSLGASACYTYLLEGLSTGSEACKYERVIRLPRMDDIHWKRRSKKEDLAIMAQEIHLAFRGRLYSGDELVWQDLTRTRTEG